MPVTPFPSQSVMFPKPVTTIIVENHCANQRLETISILETQVLWFLESIQAVTYFLSQICNG